MNTTTNEKTILGHPRGLFILFFTEMWERFSYYGMRGLLIVYLTQHFLFSDERSAVLYGAYTALVYVMTIIGGSLADKYLGSRKAVTFGAILLVLGHFGMAFEGNGSRQVLEYGDTTYEVQLDARGGDARQLLVSGDTKSYITFSETEMFIEDGAAFGLENVVPREDITLKVVTEEFYLNVLYFFVGLNHCRCWLS